MGQPATVTDFPINTVRSEIAGGLPETFSETYGLTPSIHQVQALDQGGVALLQEVQALRTALRLRLP